MTKKKKWTPAPKTKRRTGTIAKNFIGNRDPKQRPIPLKVDCNVGGIQGKVAKAFAAGMSVVAVIKFLMKRFPETEGDFGLHFPGSSDPESKNKEPFWFDNEKKLMDYDDAFFKEISNLRIKIPKRRSKLQGKFPKLQFQKSSLEIQLEKSKLLEPKERILKLATFPILQLFFLQHR